jgi:hypothetical protein
MRLKNSSVLFINELLIGKWKNDLVQKHLATKPAALDDVHPMAGLQKPGHNSDKKYRYEDTKLSHQKQQ